ncbi:LysE family translocator [Lihuaxuella thermophila]|uniref:Threonine/homoserine/homoserine lactone efflux protein n=1 Tax=Lihuaxuella thermophila TaxID=1173111 RepID=A0A1H8G3V8_9BACL|nr:LysE family translocator [Lihuaxuella thermophila]SEN38579.1 Threonine/homoserine/homoserine lactone efflux protein [Lihuaxuella thermophila]
MELSNLIQFLTASVILTLMPGPDNLFVMAQSITHGRKAGIATSLGLCTGITFHTMAAAFGVAALFYQSSVAFQFVKYAGAAYLLYLAWQAVKESKHPLPSSVQSVSGQNLRALFKRGIVMNVTNPKVSLFFLAFLPQFVSPEAGNLTWQMIGLGLLFMLQAILIFTLISVLSGTFGQKLITNRKIHTYIHLGKAALFTVIGVRLALAEK